MVRIITGVILILIGFATFNDPEAPFVWIGGFIIGGILVVRGIKGFKQKRNFASYEDFFQQQQKWIKDRLFEGKPISAIAIIFFSQSQIPVRLTYYYCGELLFELLHQKDIDKSEIHRIIQIQSGEKKRFEISDSSFIFRYEGDSGILSGKKRIKGIFVIFNTTILFCPSGNGIGNKIGKYLWDKMYEIPIIGFIPGFFDLIFALKNEIQTEVTASELSKLKQEFSNGNCTHIEIADITSFEITQSGPWYRTAEYLVIKAKGGRELWLNSAGKKSTEVLQEQIRITSLANGNLIP